MLLLRHYGKTLVFLLWIICSLHTHVPSIEYNYQIQSDYIVWSCIALSVDFVTGWLIKYATFFISYFVCMCLDTCSKSSWQYHLTCAMTFYPTHFAMVTISFLFPLLPAHILVLCLTSDSPE